MLGSDATIARHKLAEGYSIDNPAIELKKLCIAVNMPFLCIAQDGLGIPSG